MTDACSWCSKRHAGGPERCLRGVLLVCGGRDYVDRKRVYGVLDRVAARMEITALRHGAARGADSLAGAWAREREVDEQARPAEWVRLGKAAGSVRNAAMLAEGGVVAAVAFPGGTGTADMVRKLKAAGVPVWEVSL